MSQQPNNPFKITIFTKENERKCIVFASISEIGMENEWKVLPPDNLLLGQASRQQAPLSTPQA